MNAKPRPKHLVTLAQWVILLCAGNDRYGLYRPTPKEMTPARNLIAKGYGSWKGRQFLINRQGIQLVR